MRALLRQLQLALYRWQRAMVLRKLEPWWVIYHYDYGADMGPLGSTVPVQRRAL